MAEKNFLLFINSLKSKDFIIKDLSDLRVLVGTLVSFLKDFLLMKRSLKKSKTKLQKDFSLNKNIKQIKIEGNMISKELEETLKLAYKEAKKRRHEYITLEHILYALTFDKTASDVLYNCGSDIKELRKNVESFLTESIPSVSEEIKDLEPLYTLSVQRVLQFAAIHVQSSEKGEVSGSDILVSLFREKDSHSVYFLSQQKITRLDVIKYVSHKISKIPVEAQEPVYQDGDDSSSDSKKKKNALEVYCINLNKRAEDGKIDPLIGRDKELERIIHVLSRRRKNNPIMVGDLDNRIKTEEIPKA